MKSQGAHHENPHFSASNYVRIKTNLFSVFLSFQDSVNCREYLPLSKPRQIHEPARFVRFF
jgi:hypothetical protein